MRLLAIVLLVSKNSALRWLIHLGGPGLILWIYIPDSATAAAALNAGEADIWEQLPPDLIPVLAKNKDVTVKNIDPLGSMGMIRFNFLYPPFNNEKMRQALLYMVNQQDYVIGIAGDAKNGHPCYSYFTCCTPLSSLVGAIVGIALIVFAQHGRDKPIPFGPYLVVAGLTALLWGPAITSRYLQLF